MTNTKNLLVLMLLLALGVFTACGGSDDTPKPEDDVKTTQISKTWNVTKFQAAGSSNPVTVSGVTITFKSDKTFTITDTAPVLPFVRSTNEHLPASGTWDWANTNQTQITLKGADDVTLSNVNVSASSLNFEYSGYMEKDAEPQTTFVISAVPAE